MSYLFLVLLGGGILGGGFMGYRWLEGHDAEVAKSARLECQAKHAEADRLASVAALAESKNQRDADIELLSDALASAKERTIIREKIHAVKSPDCRRLPAAFGELRNAGLTNIIRIPAQTPSGPSAVPPPAADNPAAAAR